MTPWDMLERAYARNDALAQALGAAIGGMMNARISLETGETKASVIKELTRAITLAEKPIDEIRDRLKVHPKNGEM